MGHDFKNSLIEQEYVIKTKPDSSRNMQVNVIIYRVHQVLRNRIRYFNLNDTYVYDADPWMRTLAAAAFVVRATYHRTKQKSLGQLVFGQDMILPINHLANWILICQRKQAQIDNDVIRKNSTRVDHDYRIVDCVMVRGKMTLNMKHHLKVRMKLFKIGQT